MPQDKPEKWTPSEEAYLKSLVEREHLNDSEISARFKKEGIQRTRKAIQLKRQREGWRAQVLPSPAPRFDRELTLRADRSLLLFDIHAPFHDYAWINRVIGLARRYRCTGCGIGGDLIDLVAFAKFGRQIGLEASEEFKATDQLLSALVANFEQIVYAGGNHEERLPKMVKGLMGVEEVMALWVRSDKVQTTSYHWFWLESAGERFQVHHPESFSSTATAVPRKLAISEGCHIIAGHGHLWGVSRDPSDRYWCVDAGACADIKRLGYANLVKRGRPKMVQGAVMVIDGTPILLSPDNIGFYESATALKAAA